jgi:uncharacterized C2H2 Zn-finger protein
MAGARRQPSQDKAEQFKCPECGRTFTRAAALGAHRRRAHGVVGAVAQARTQRKRRSSSATANSASTRTATSAATGRRTGRAARASARQVDRDALLQLVFPGGVPAREAVIRDANAWLDEAGRLTQLK